MRNRIWIPEYDSSLDTPIPTEVVVAVHCGTFSGLCKVELIDGKTGEVKEHYEFPNVIVSNGLDQMGAGNILMSDFFDTLYVGTGSTTPSPSDVALEDPVGSTDSDGGFGGTSGYVTGADHGVFGLGNPYHFATRVRVFNENEVNFGLTELGFSESVGLLNRALFKDNSGTPVTINKTPTDQLKITYEMRMYPPTTHFSGSFVMANSDVTHSWTASAVDIDNSETWGFVNQSGQRGWFNGFGGWVNSGLGRAEQVFVSASVPGNPTGTVVQWGWLTDGQNESATSRSIDPYVDGTFTRRRLAQWNPAKALFGSGGLQGFAFQYSRQQNQFGVYITPSIKKTDTQLLTFVWDTAFSASVTASL